MQRVLVALMTAMIALNAAMPASADRTVTASRSCSTGLPCRSGCSSAAKCAALATLDSMDVKLYELLPFCTPQLYKFSYSADRFGTWPCVVVMKA